jgi:voltage-gated potassium channel Kch
MVIPGPRNARPRIARYRGRGDTARWPLVAMLVAAAALTLGYFGLAEQVRHTDLGHSPSDLLYYDIQLFVMSSPPVDSKQQFPLILQIARFAAPIVTVYTLVEAARRLFSAEFALLRIRRARGHDVVCGDGPIADALVARLSRENKRLVHISEHDGGPTVQRTVRGDPASAAVLLAAGVPHARALYVCTPSGTTNIAVALAVSGLVRHESTMLSVHTHIDDPELCLALQARRLGLPQSQRLHVNFFSADELAVRTLVAEEPPPIASDRESTFMVVGASQFGVALVVELARVWRERSRSARRVHIVLVDPNGHDEVARLHRRFPFLATTCRFTVHEVDVERMLDGDLPDEAPDRVYLCGRNEEATLKLALTMDQFWQAGSRSVVVCLNQLGGLGGAFLDDGDRQLLDDVSGALVLFDVVRAGTDPELVEDSLVERLGRAMHANYVTARRQAGAPGDERTLVPWADLIDAHRAANRAQAADIGRKLRAMECVLAPSPIWGTPVVLTDVTVEMLARLEHGRWTAYVREQGWEYGSVHDSVAKRHPDLLPWSDLPPVEQEKNKAMIRDLPSILAEVGFQIVPAVAARSATAIPPMQRIEASPDDIVRRRLAR